MDNDVSLTMSKEIVTPIVETKIKEALLAALGGKEELIEKIVEQVFTQKVNSSGNVSNYPSDNKHSWLDVVVTNKIRDAVKEEVTKIIGENSKFIVEAVRRQLTTKAGQNAVAKALLAGLSGTLENAWKSNIKISFNELKTD